jgi:hypothetical protein
MATRFLTVTSVLIDLDVNNYSFNFNGVLGGISWAIASTTVPKAGLTSANITFTGTWTITQVGSNYTTTFSNSTINFHYINSGVPTTVTVAGAVSSSPSVAIVANHVTLDLSSNAGPPPSGVTLTPATLSSDIIISANAGQVGVITSTVSPGDTFVYYFNRDINFDFVFDAGLGGYALKITSALFPEVDISLLAGPQEIAADISNLLVSYVYDAGTQTYSMTVQIPAGGFATLGGGSNILPISQTITGINIGGTTSITNTFGSSDATVLNGNNNRIQVGSNTTPIPIYDTYIIDLSTLCLHEDSLVHTTNGLIKIKDLRSDMGLKLIDYSGQQIELVAMIRTLGGVQKFVKFEAGSLGQNSPCETLRVTHGHPIFHAGSESRVLNFINDRTITQEVLKVDYLYNIATKNRTYVMINNVPVCTWAINEFETKVAARGMYFEKF